MEQHGWIPKMFAKRAFMSGLCLSGLLLTGCGQSAPPERPPWGDEVSRVSSPDNRVDALLFEENGGATVSFGYSVYLVPKGGVPLQADRVAGLYAAARSEQASGVNLKWQNDEVLRIEFLEVRKRRYLTHTANINGNKVRIFLVDGMNDPEAPAGGMLYNLRGRVPN